MSQWHLKLCGYVGSDWQRYSLCGELMTYRVYFIRCQINYIMGWIIFADEKLIYGLQGFAFADE